MTTKKASSQTADVQATFANTVQQLASLHADNAEKTFELQMGIFKSYLDTTLGQYKALAAIGDVKEMPEVMKANAAQVQAAAAKSAADFAEIVKVNTAYGQNVQGLVRDMATKVMPTSA